MTFLFGRKIIVFTDHRHLTFDTLRSQCALQWHLVVEEFSVIIIHREGANNLAADAMSRIPLMDSDDPFSMRKAEERFAESYLFYPVHNKMDTIYPLSFKSLEEGQHKDINLITILNKPASKYSRIKNGNFDLVHFRVEDGPQEFWKIVIPVLLIDQVLQWFHQVL